MEGFNPAICIAIDSLCRQLQRSKEARLPSLPLRIEQPLAKPFSTSSGTSNTLDQADLALWLAQQSSYPKFYWRCRDQTLETACLGMAQQFSGKRALQQLHSGNHYRDGLRYYWLSGFAPEQTNTPPLMFLPQIELRAEVDPQTRRRQLTLSAIVIGDNGKNLIDSIRQQIDQRISQLQQLRPLPALPAKTNLAIFVDERTDSPCFEQWQHSVEQAKRAFSEGLLQKVVLARQTTFQICDDNADDKARPHGDSTSGATSQSFWKVFLRWRGSAVNNYQIAYQASPDRGFISLTPERLFARQDLHLKTEALAATLTRSNNKHQARRQARQLLSDSKSRHEHGLVAVEVGAKLEGLGVTLNHGCGTSLLKQNGIQHLHQTIQGQLPKAQMDAQLFSTLHPTAAIGGLPTKPAQQFIDQHEPFSRGYYAGCCGYFDAACSELAVTIRSADFNGTRMTLYAGAGIVPQSDAKREWVELDQKIALPLSLFDSSPEQQASSHPRTDQQNHQQRNADVI